MNSVANAVVPVFGTVALGYGLARAGLFNAATGSALVRFTYYLAIPAMLFQSLLSAELPPAVPWRFLAAFYGPAVLVFGLGMLLARWRFGWAPQEAGMAGMVSGYSNMVLLGFPLTLNAFGAEGAVPMFILLATQSTLLFPLTTYALELNAPGRTRGLRKQAETMAGLALNPIIASLVLGVAANLGAVTVAEPLGRLLALLGAAAPGCALIALGISLGGYRLGGGYADVLALTVLKNFVHPLLVWLACIALHVPTTWLKVAVVLAAMPAGVNAFIFASQYRVREHAVSRCIVLSTLVSSLTATLLLALLE